MTKLNTISLISVDSSTVDAIGQVVETERLVPIIAEVRSITQSEFMEASQNGLSPSYLFRVSVFGYSGEKSLIYNGARYSVYRTYETDDNYIELYTESKVGERDA